MKLIKLITFLSRSFNITQTEEEFSKQIKQSIKKSRIYLPHIKEKNIFEKPLKLKPKKIQTPKLNYMGIQRPEEIQIKMPKLEIPNTKLIEHPMPEFKMPEFNIKMPEPKKIPKPELHPIPLSQLKNFWRKKPTLKTITPGDVSESMGEFQERMNTYWDNYQKRNKIGAKPTSDINIFFKFENYLKNIWEEKEILLEDLEIFFSEKFQDIRVLLDNLYIFTGTNLYDVYYKLSDIFFNAYSDLTITILETGILNSIAKFNFLNVLICVSSPFFLVALLTKILKYFLKNREITPFWAKNIILFFEKDNNKNLKSFLKSVLIISFILINYEYLQLIFNLLSVIIHCVGAILPYILKESIMVILNKLIGSFFPQILFPIEIFLIFISKFSYCFALGIIGWCIVAFYSRVISPLTTQIIMNMLLFFD